MKGTIKNRYQISNLLGSVISNFRLEYVVFLLKYAISVGPFAPRSPLREPVRQDLHAPGARLQMPSTRQSPQQ